MTTSKNSDNTFMGMFQNFGENLKLPIVDVNSVIDYHRKNIQALQDMTQVTSNSTRSLMAKQREVLEETLAEVSELIKSASETEEPGKMVSNQMEFAKRSFDTTIKNTTEMGEIVRDMNMKSYEVLKNRIGESISDIRDSMAGKR